MKGTIIIFLVSVMYLNLSAQNKMTDPRDGNTYRTIAIAGTTWMSENLKYAAEGSGANCFDNNPDNIPVYGVLYDWKAALNACPEGWHLPAGSEFRTLMNHFESDEAWEKTGSVPVSFSIQLAGMRDYEGTFSEMDESAYFWTSTEYDENEAEFFSYMIINKRIVIDISRKEDMPDIHGAEKTNRYSVRCVKN
jgi:uncharacterized protein (TIGR02145 family)